MNKKIRVAIVDSGVNKQHSAFDQDKIVTVGDRNMPKTNLFGHGTAIYNIIRTVDDIAEIINFQLDFLEDGIEESCLVNVLLKIDQEYDVDVINLSLGINICEDVAQLYSVCKKLTDKGVLIISAFDNAGSMSYPAAFENVIGVTDGAFCTKTTDFEYMDDVVVNLGAKGGIQRLAWDSPEYIMLGGNSFACAHVTVQVVKFMSQGIQGFKNIIEQFKKVSVIQHPKASYITPSFNMKINKAVIFPFNKEMHSLIRFSNLLSFKIVDVYDIKYSANVGATTDHVMKSEVESFLIKNIEKINWDNFDTLILGHLDELSSLINKKKLKEQLINLALNKHKNVFAFDDASDITSHPNLYYPTITKQHLPPARFGKLFRISKPVLGIYGTSSRQGKFTLQLELRKKFIQHKYTVGQIGTEPSALLYGLDYVYPMGYNNSVYIHEYESIQYLNFIINDLCQKKYDIILTGSQSGTLPYDTGNLSQFSIPQLNFLLGTQPDAIVLCVNPFDDIDYLERTIKFLESSVDSKVVALVVFPMTLKNDWSGMYGQKRLLTTDEYKLLKTNLNFEFSIPVLQLGIEEDMDLLIETIICFFSE